ncbi:sodium/hydrogen exchanger 9-like isoform X2 [Limulus polyphemus]|uniref:Sodium/hydrogen exchanger n=1 Tax=Limulus polyphemus TaxID=6850 RepID=A0ABM1T8I6_LIMPO|nr:sodium/hydrogen exchanger 9-like isoform X2 [Limulus polyphemus]
MMVSIVQRLVLSVTLLFCLTSVLCNAPTDIKLDEKAKRIHRIDCLNILVYVLLLILTVCTIWLFKRRRARFLHETGLAIIYGLVVGAIIRYGGEDTEVVFVAVKPISHNNTPVDIPPDNLFYTMEVKGNPVKGDLDYLNKTYAYVFRGEVTDVESKKLDQKATFDPEIFFNIILPPIIFNAGYSLKRRHFFRNLGAIMTYAFIGTTISCFVVGIVIYAFIQLMPHLQFSFTDCLYFGAIISATDPVTVLALLSDLHVDVNLYALVFGESILNDAVAIVLSGSINSYEELYGTQSGGFEVQACFKSVGNFIYIFICSFLIGSVTGCCTALLTKFTRLNDFPLLESSLFLLMSYSTFLISEAADLSGIVAVLFCGICQAHYTYNNLSDESRIRTKQLFELLSFVAESFIFTYIGVSMFTFTKHLWDVGFIIVAFLAIAVGRAVHVYPLSFLLNLGRHNKISLNFQHMLFFSGLRGAMAFALAFRNTLSEPRQLILTTTSMIAIVTVFFCGGITTQLLTWLGIPVGVEEEHEMLQLSGAQATPQVSTPNELRSPPPVPENRTPYEKAWLVRKWHNFDVMFMKPLLTHSQPTLMETLPGCCLPFSKLLTTEKQLSQEGIMHNDDDSDSDLEIIESNFTTFRGRGLSSQNSVTKPFCIEDANATVSDPQSPEKNTSVQGDIGIGSGLNLRTHTRIKIPGFEGEPV